MNAFLLLIPFILNPFGQMCDQKETIEGYLQLYGTDHFPQLAVITDLQQRYFLDISPEEHDRIWGERQRRIRITGCLHEDEWRGQTRDFIVIDEWSWVIEDRIDPDQDNQKDDCDEENSDMNGDRN